jgi:hypothetical protein
MWALFGILHMLDESGGQDGLGQLSSVFWYVLAASILSLGAITLTEICIYVSRRD